MQSNAKTPDEYIKGLPDDRKAAVAAIRKVVNDNLPRGFKECITYGHIGWVVSKETYPPGYHCDPTKPLMLMSLASTKGHISLHHMGIYGSGPLMEWFRSVWAKATLKKLDMGKACVRFKKPEDIPLALVGELASKLTPQQWVEIYQKAMRRE